MYFYLYIYNDRHTHTHIYYYDKYIYIYMFVYVFMYLFIYCIISTTNHGPSGPPYRRRVPGASSTRPAARPLKAKRWSPSLAPPTARGARCSTPFGRCPACCDAHRGTAPQKEGVEAVEVEQLPVIMRWTTIYHHANSVKSLDFCWLNPDLHG